MAGMPPSRTPRRAAPDPRLTALAEESGYEILGRIGAGGMGIVYRAHDADGNDVAIKLLRHEISDDARARERLSREVAAQKLVRNDNIVRILDAELESSEAFVVTEFVPGPTLEDAVRTHGGLHPEAVREIALVMGQTLQAIHEAGVIHRDLKPSNVMLRGATEADLTGFDPDGDRLDPVIIDFGIAIAAEESRLTSTGLVMGTAAYLDPEVIRTDHAGEAGDWRAWAALLAYAATGREPYGGGRADLVFLRAERGEIDIDGVPTELGQWLRAALQSDPARRPEPAQLLERLAALDLTYYDDPGDTELLGTGARTAVLPVSGAAAGAADDARSAEDEESEPAAPGEEDLAERTAVLPVQDSPPTQPIPAEQPTETLPRVTTAQEPVTETLPVTGAPTRALPVVPPQGGGPPVAGPAPAQLMPQQYAPVPAPQQYALAPAPHPYGDVRGADPRCQAPQAVAAAGRPGGPGACAAPADAAAARPRTRSAAVRPRTRSAPLRRRPGRRPAISGPAGDGGARRAGGLAGTAAAPAPAGVARASAHRVPRG